LIRSQTLGIIEESHSHCLCIINLDEKGSPHSINPIILNGMIVQIGKNAYRNSYEYFESRLNIFKYTDNWRTQVPRYDISIIKHMFVNIKTLRGDVPDEFI